MKKVPLEDFLKLTKFPIVIYYGDYVPKADEVTKHPHNDYWRAATMMSDAFAKTVNRHGGDIYAKSGNGQTEFCFTIPVN